MKVSSKILNERAVQLSNNIDSFYKAMNTFNKCKSGKISCDSKDLANLQNEVTKYDLEVKTGFTWFICNGYSKAIEVWMTKFNPKGITLYEKV